MTPREELAARQAALVRALLADGPVPAGFDPGRLARQGAALRAKRRRVVEGARPDLVTALGEREFAALFGAWARAHPPRVGGCPHADAAAFAAWLDAEHHLPAAAGRRPSGRIWRRTRPGP